MSTKTRIYVVDQKSIPVRLVRAANKAQARNHVARQTFHVELAGQDVLVNLIASGVKVEDAAAEDEKEDE